MSRQSRAASALATTALATVFVAAISQSAFAQSAPASTPAKDGASKPPEVAEVVVTAEKRSELASKTPLAVTAFTGSTLKSEGVIDISDLQNIAPAVTVGRDNFGVNISIRGVTSTDNTSKGDEGIAFNVDGIPIGRPVEEALSFFDVNRIEVLRGPQGTLYGKSSTGGAVNIITNRPTSDFGAYADMEYGNYDTRRGDAMLNVPVTDNFALRFAGDFNERDGYLVPKLGDPAGGQVYGKARNDEDDMTGRVSGLYKFSDDANLLVTVTGGHIGGVGSSAGILNQVLNHSGDAQREVYGNPFGGDINDSFLNVNGEFNANLGPVHLTYDGAHLSFVQHDITSSTNDPLGNYQGPPPATGVYAWRDYHGHFATDSHELRFSNRDKGRFDWVLGANWYREDIHESDHNWNVPVANPVVAASTNGIDPVNQTTHTSYSVFGQTTVHLTDIFGVVLGLREGHDQLIRVGSFAAGPGPWPNAQGGTCTAPQDCIGGPNNGRESASKLTYRAGLNAQFTPNQLAYVSVANGYKAGGFNDFDPVTHSTGVYAPESMTAYELGYKGKPLSNLRFNSALFYYDYSKDQISSLLDISGNFVIYTRTVPTTIYGWENEFTWAATSDDTFDGALTLEKSKYDTFYAGLLQNVNWSGYSLDRTPAATFNLGYTHVWTLPKGGTLKLRAETKYSSDYKLSDYVNAVQYTQGAFTRSDLIATYTPQDARYYVQLFVRNLEDNIQVTGNVGGTTASVPNAATGAVSTPRFFGARVGFTY